MSKLRLTAMAFGTILVAVPSSAPAQKTGSKPSAEAAQAQTGAGSPSRGQSTVKSREIAGTNLTGTALRAQDVTSREMAGVNFVGTALRAQEIKSRAIEGTNFVGAPATRAPGTP
jgi:uncharacterized protein YjbI with pentapeptide repeats